MPTTWSPTARPAAAGEHGVVGVCQPHPGGLHPAGQLSDSRFVEFEGRCYLLSGDHVRLLDRRRFAFLGRDEDCVLDHARSQIAGYKQPILAVAVDAIPRTTTGKVDFAAARSLAATAGQEPDSTVTGTARTPDKAAPDSWARLPELARREQALLAVALESLFVDPETDARISRALGYPQWPQLLLCYPRSRQSSPPHTALAAYLDFIGPAAGEASGLLERHGWPNARSAPGVADAAWILLQHADLRDQDRATLLNTLTSAVTRILLNRTRNTTGTII